MNNPTDFILSRLKALQARKRAQTISQKTAKTVCIGLSILALVFVGVRIISFPFSTVHITLFVLFVSLILGIFLGFRYKITLFNIASYVDNHLKLKSRLITALELIQTNREDEIAKLQINDTSNNIAEKDLSKTVRHTVPAFLKWIPIPLLIIGLSYAIPRQYTVPLPPTIAEKEAIDNTIKMLTHELEESEDADLHERIKKTIEKLENAKDVITAHGLLQELNDAVRKQKSTLPDESAVAQATQATHHFKDMDTTALTNELQSLAEQDELTPEVRAEIEKLLEKLAENAPQGVLNQIQGKTVSQDTLKDIIKTLNQIEQLNSLEAQLTESRKNIALASIETDQQNGNIASSNSGPGQETGTQETQGTQVNPNNSEFSTTNDDTNLPTVENDSEKPIIGDETQTLQTNGKTYEISSEVASDSQSNTRVYSGNLGDSVDEPEYLPFTDVVLNAQRDYAQAVENNRIPLQYRSQIRTYLEGLSKVNEQ